LILTYYGKLVRELQLLPDLKNLKIIFDQRNFHIFYLSYGLYIMFRIIIYIGHLEKSKFAFAFFPVSYLFSAVSAVYAADTAFLIRANNISP
jgi:hypothetical protein